MKKSISILLIIQLFLLSVPAIAQNGDEDLIKNTQNDIMLVGAAGAAGAVLGLSTLSFVDKPSKHISNIWTGAALGVIAGVIFVAYNSAQRGSEEMISSVPGSDFNTSDRSQWHSQNDRLLSFQPVQFGTQFWQTSF